MKRQLTVGRVAVYLLCLSAAFALVVGVSYSRFTGTVRGSGSAAVAAVAMEGTSNVDLTTALAGLAPGTSRTISFTVANAKNGVVSEVAQSYVVEVETTGNLPLTFSLVGTTPAANEGRLADLNDGAAAVWENGLLPAGKQVNHLYTLTVAWPKDKSDAAYAREVDAVSLHIRAVQALPEAAGK